MKYLMLLSILLIAGCAAAVPIAMEAAPVVLDEAAKIACNAQAQANAAGQSMLSQTVGFFCKW